MDESSVSRRDFIKKALGGVGALAFAVPSSAKILSAVCGAHIEQPEGPFYPVSDRDDEDTDLTQVRGRSGVAEGQHVYVYGKVLGEDCLPLAGVLVEIWQANSAGRYDHPGDRDNPAPLDPNFQSWGEVLTRADGSYFFRTVIPGHYPAGDGWMRPPHVHFKISKRGYHELITQMYFAGNRYNDQDRILRSLPASEQERVVITPGPAPIGSPDPTLQGYAFDLMLKKVS